MDPGTLAKNLGITDKHVIGKANEFSRLVHIRAPSGLGQGELARGAACLLIACKSKDIPIDKQKACQFCCVTQAQLISVTAMCQRLLGIKDELTTKEMCKKLGHPLLIADTEDVLRRYKAKFSKTLTQEQKTYADFTRSVYPAAAFFIAAHKNKVKITQAAIANNLDIQKPELQKVIASMQITLEPPPPPKTIVTQNPIVASKRKLEDNNEDNKGDNENESITKDKINEGTKDTNSDNNDDIISTIKPPPPVTTTTSTIQSGSNNKDDDDNYMAFRKIAEDLGLHCDKEDEEKKKKKKEEKEDTNNKPPPLKKPKKFIQTTLKF